VVVRDRVLKTPSTGQKAVVSGDGGPAPGVTSMVKGLPDSTRVVVDDERAVANAGVVLPAGSPAGSDRGVDR
jgi:hypothetical protein